MNEAPTVQLLTLGEDRGRGNVLGIQPSMTPADYAAPRTIYTKLAGYLSLARRENWLGRRTVVVWPEHLGTWLMATNEPEAVRDAPTVNEAMRALAKRYPVRLARAFLSSSERDKRAAALFRMKSEEVASLYQTLFSQLARDYGVTTVAGSVVLSDPQVREGRLVVEKGPLYNVSAVFSAEGVIYDDLVRKVYPVEAELGFTTPAEVADLPAFGTDAGRLGVLICADAWYPAPYTTLDFWETEIIAVPSHGSKPGSWDKPWGGYNGASAPDDVDPDDVGRLTEAEAWARYALAGRIGRSSARAGINVFLSGALWDLGTEGASMMIVDDEEPVHAEPHRPALLNLWL